VSRSSFQISWGLQGGDESLTYDRFALLIICVLALVSTVICFSVEGNWVLIFASVFGAFHTLSLSFARRKTQKTPGKRNPNLDCG
jgi:hypothetical protein